MLVGAPNADNNGRTASGSAYVVYGYGRPQLAYRPLQAQVGKVIEPHEPTQLARTGTPTSQVSPPLPGGLRLQGLGVITGTPTTAQARTTHRVTMTDLAGSVSANLVVTVAAPPDMTAPALTLRAASPQRVSRQRAVRLSASCNEACRLLATGRIRLLGSSQSMRCGCDDAAKTRRIEGVPVLGPGGRLRQPRA